MPVAQFKCYLDMFSSPCEGAVSNLVPLLDALEIINEKAALVLMTQLSAKEKLVLPSLVPCKLPTHHCARSVDSISSFMSQHDKVRSGSDNCFFWIGLSA